jgi:protein TonB
MKNIFVILLFLNFAVGFGQNNDAPKEDEKLIKENTTEKNDETDYDQIYTSVQVQAVPPGGMNAFRKYIASSFKLPEVSEKTLGTIIVKFVVWDDGSIRDINIIKENPVGLGLGKEAVRVLTNSAKWTPGQYNGRSIKQYYTIPISLQIAPLDKIVQPIKEIEASPKKD